MDGLSMHYYTVPGESWMNKGFATEFTTDGWYQALGKALHMDDLIKKHGAILDQYDPEKKIGLIVDEWGNWHEVEPGTNPGFLYQQNTMRDALVAAVTLNIFNKRCDRVKMACIAQLINVLQSVILTEGEKMILTPTYHIFHMYKYHQDAELLRSDLTGVDTIQNGEFSIPALQESVSVQKDGTITVTLANLSAEQSYPVEIALTEKKNRTVSAKILTGAMNAHNTFEEPDAVKEESFEGVAEKDGTLSLEIPACSVICLRIS